MPIWRMAAVVTRFCIGYEVQAAMCRARVQLDEWRAPGAKRLGYVCASLAVICLPRATWQIEEAKRRCGGSIQTATGREDGGSHAITSEHFFIPRNIFYHLRAVADLVLLTGVFSVWEISLCTAY